MLRIETRASGGSEPGVSQEIASDVRHAVITVSDTGDGMSEDTRQRIFEPFFTSKDAGHGTGLGLAIVYGIIEQHGGRIRVESELGKGSTFTIELPLIERPAPQSVSDAVQESLPRGSETILIAEDELGVQRFLETVLTSYGYKVLVAGDGQEAVDVYLRNQEKIALVLMDLVMPRRSGKAAQQEISRHNPAAKVLFMSGYTADLIASRGDLEHGTDLVMKPILPETLLRRVREFIDRAE
jgi:polar amino acid transport system substrate-binding protein